MIKKIIKITGASILVILIMYLGILPAIPVGNLHPNGTHKIYITSNEIHTGFFFPKEEASVFNDFVNYSDFQYSENEGLEFSFGDKDFFEKAPTWDKFTFNILIDALFIPEEGLVHIDIFDKNTVATILMKELNLNDEQFNQLVNLIKDSFQIKNGKPIVYKNLSYYKTDRFYLSKDKYSVITTCNSWTNNILKKLNITTGLISPHKWGVLWHL